VAVKTPQDLSDQLWVHRDPDADFSHQEKIIRSIMAWYKDYDFVGNPRTLEWLLECPATTFEQFATKAYAELSASEAP
jgi:hypothetical protein